MNIAYGRVNINGYEVNWQKHASNFFNLYSPDTHSSLCIKPATIESCQSSPPASLDSVLNNIQALVNITCEQTLNNLVNFLNQSLCDGMAVILVLKKLKQTFPSYLANFDNFNQIYGQPLPKVDRTQQYDVQFAHLDMYPVSDPIFLYEQNADELAAMATILNQYENRMQCPKVLIAGGKDAGKSTYSRYMVNSFLNKYNKCAYIDCDLGQCEFTLSTCLQLTYVEEPLFGPPHTHINHTGGNDCLFVGVLSPSDIPDYYLNCLDSLSKTYANDEKKCPLVINTMGWNQGLGLCLLKEQISLFKPDFVIQINTTDANRNMPLITHEWFETSTHAWPPLNKHTAPGYQHFVLERNLRKDSESTRKRRFYSPKDHRTIATICYFADLHDSVTGFRSIHQLRPYRIPWSKFGMHVLHVKIEFSEIFRVFNASLVALCRVDPKFLKNFQSTANDLPMCIDTSLNQQPLFSCIGFGIVRAINFDTKELYILTPELENKLDDVNCLVKGMLNVPLEFFYQQDYDTNPCPYVTFVDNMNVVASEPIQRKFLVHSVSSMPTAYSKNNNK